MKKSLVPLVLLLGVSGAAFSAEPGKAGCSFLPVVLDGPAPGSRYQTELTLTNPNGSAVTLDLAYTPAQGWEGGKGTAVLELLGGEQKFIPDGIAFLRSSGIGIPQTSGMQAGTLLVCPSSVPVNPVAVAARVVSETRPPVMAGKAGVSFLAVPAHQGQTGRATVFGLRANLADRSNVAAYNPGELSVELQVTAYSGEGGGKSVVLFERLDVAPFGWVQIDNVMAKAGFEQGWVTFERISKEGVFGAYGVVNDNGTNDGSFIQAEADRIGAMELLLPVLVDTAAYQTELYFANRGGMLGRFQVEFVDSASGKGSATFTVSVPERSQLILQDAFAYIRAQLGVEAGGAGMARIRTLGSPMQDLYTGARVLTRTEGGRFGVFAPSIAATGSSAPSGIVSGLRADGTVRSNVAVFHAGTEEEGPIELVLRAVDGRTAEPSGQSLTVELRPGQWVQPSGFFAAAGIESGYVRITRVSGTAAWSAYGVVNDGEAPGKGTSDGSYLPVVFLSESGRPDGQELLPTGPWGGPGIVIWVTGPGATIEASCASGLIDGPIFLTEGVDFKASGEWVIEGPGPIREPGSRFAAEFKGHLKGDRLLLEISLAPGAVGKTNRFDLVRGEVPRIHKCG